jgi:CheY-like chemotaxis protein
MQAKDSKTVMLLDDSEIDNYINKKFIEDRGISNNVLVMGTAEKALKYLRDHQTNLQEIPDLIVLDINLPAITGFGFLKEFRKLPDPVKQKCKIVVLSSSDKDEDITHMEIDPLVIRYFIKPLSEEALRQIKELLN